jgi:hypothetical protein
MMRISNTSLGPVPEAEQARPASRGFVNTITGEEGEAAALLRAQSPARGAAGKAHACAGGCCSGPRLAPAQLHAWPQLSCTRGPGGARAACQQPPATRRQPAGPTPPQPAPARHPAGPRPTHQPVSSTAAPTNCCPPPLAPPAGLFKPTAALPDATMLQGQLHSAKSEIDKFAQMVSSSSRGRGSSSGSGSSSSSSGRGT